MKSTCSHCGTTYRIDPRKVPAQGVRARCSRCGGVFEIAAPPAAASLASRAAPAMAPPPGFETTAAAPPPPVAPEQDAEGHLEPLPELGEPMAHHEPEPPAAPEPLPELTSTLPEPAQAPPPAAPEAPRHEPPPAPRPAPTPSVGARPQPSPLFGRPDPHGKARRLARALISDIAVYNPERRDRGIEQGTLRQEFRDEIRKSWDEYVAQVGDSIARGTPYFREALNEILAGGRTVF